MDEHRRLEGRASPLPKPGAPAPAVKPALGANLPHSDRPFGRLQYVALAGFLFGGFGLLKLGWIAVDGARASAAYEIDTEQYVSRGRPYQKALFSPDTMKYNFYVDGVVYGGVARHWTGLDGKLTGEMGVTYSRHRPSLHVAHACVGPQLALFLAPILLGVLALKFL